MFSFISRSKPATNHPPPSSIAFYPDEEKAFTNASNEEKAEKLRASFFRAASSDDVEKLDSLLEEFKDWIHVDMPDDDNATPLIYASCLGAENSVKWLLSKGASINCQDKNGWTPLMWATNAHHQQIVRILVTRGASQKKKTKKGTTVLDFVAHAPDCKGTLELKQILESGFFPHIDDEKFMSNPEWAYRRAVSTLKLVTPADDFLTSLSDDTDAKGAEDGFDWEKCNPDQMFVFTELDTRHILNTFITEMKPRTSSSYRFVPADVIFYCARYALNYNNAEFMESFLIAAFQKMNTVVTEHCNDLGMVIFWLANASRLLFYLKKDQTLDFTGSDLQDEMVTLLHFIYDTTALSLQNLLAKCLDGSLLSHDPIGVSDIKFERRAITAFFISDVPSTEKYVPEDLSLNNTQDTMEKNSPVTVKNILTSYLFLLRIYGVHPSMIHQLLIQAFNHLNVMIQSQILLRRNLCSRSAALCIRMNITSLEEWVHSNSDSIQAYDPQIISSSLLAQLQPSIQLLQFLQVLSGLRTLPAFLEFYKGNGLVQLLNWEQVRRIVDIYRYERGEEYVPDEIAMYIRMCADEINKRVQGQLKDSIKNKTRGAPEDTSSGKSSKDASSLDSEEDSVYERTSDDGVSVKSFRTMPNMHSTRPKLAVPRALTHRPGGRFSPAMSESMFPNQPEGLSSILIFPDPSYLLTLTLPVAWDYFSDGRGGMIQASELKGEEKKTFSLIPNVPEEYLLQLDRLKSRR